MRTYSYCLFLLLVSGYLIEPATAQIQAQSKTTAGTQAPAPPANQLAQKPGSHLITLEQAIQLALEHNHNILAARAAVQQSEAEEITANLRPNPVLGGDVQYLPVFQPGNFSSDYMDTSAEFDAGLSYLFERGKKRQHRLQAAKDQTAVTRAQVMDAERQLEFNVATDFINVELAESTLQLANQDLESFQDTIDVTGARYKAGNIGLDDLLKMKLQLLQFQTDVAQAKLARTQGLADLRQLLGYESVGDDYDVASSFDYVPMHSGLEDLQAAALNSRPDLRAAQLGVNAAQSQFQLQRSISKQDVTGTANYVHTNDLHQISLFAQIPLPIFNRNQGEIKRASIAITQAQQQQLYTNGQVLTDVRDAYEGWKANDEIINLYRTGYLDDAQQSRDITDFAYKRGAASLLDFLDAERSYRATQLGYRQALASYLLSMEQLREAVGTRNLP
ncbi:MAG: TolC family protein [Acidobacteriota bacterium]|nr:TolC family protein [Acidobacteriota bacterium]